MKFGPDAVATVKNWANFDADWYLREYPDVELMHMDAAYHYLWLGQRIGRRPSADFDQFENLLLETDELLNAIVQGKAGGSLASVGGRPVRRSFAGDNTKAQLIELRSAAGDPRPFSIAVHAHVYYSSLIGEIRECLERMPRAFDLFISVPDDATRVAAISAFSESPNLNSLDARIVPNRGRDIAPFVVEFGSTLATYDIVSHIHTKKSLYNNGATDGWREYVMGSLFPKSTKINYILSELMQSDYGLIYPQSFYNLPYMAHTWLANKGIAHIWHERFGVKSIPEDYFDFPAGSMFWARTDAIRPILEAGLRWEDFPSEQGQTDGTLAHCIERMLGVVPAARGFRQGVVADAQYQSWSRWRINQFFERPLQHVYDAIADDNVKTVAFDVFDTLVMRNMLNPDYVKTVLHNRYTKAGNTKFLELRRKGEGDARSRKGTDVDIFEIYTEMMRQDPASATAYDVYAEITMEIASVRARSDVAAIFNFAKNLNKRVVLASDMFLTQDAIKQMLEACGISGWSKFYLSSEVGVRKDRGDMYEYMLREEKLTPKELMMIGDNERSDFQIPADMGIRTIHIVKPANIMRATPRLEGLVPDGATASGGDQFLFGALAAENFSGVAFPDFSAANMFGSSPRSIGYGLLGPLVLAFSQWLSAEARANNIDSLFFLSREGKFLKAAYDVWAGGGDDRISSRYLVVSRRAVTVPAIGEIEDIYAIARSNNFYGGTVDLFLLERYGIELEQSKWRKIETKGLWSRSRPLTIIDQDIVDVLPLLKFLAPDILARAASERQGCLQYLNGVLSETASRCAVVDVGYGGTIQRHLNKLMPGTFSGFYMMVNEGAMAWSKTTGIGVSGCFTGMEAGRSNGVSLMMENSFILEKMLSADDEQLMYYDTDGGLKFRDLQEYVRASSTTRKEIQDGAMQFMKDAVRFRNTIDANMLVLPKTAQNLFDEFVSEQSVGEHAALSSLSLDDYYCGRGIVS